MINVVDALIIIHMMHRTDELISFFMTSHCRTVDELGVLRKWNDGVFVLINAQTSSSESSMVTMVTDGY